jgi:hydroxyacylglutathione hydrolase
MHLQRFKTPGIAHVAYLIGDGGEAAIVDPRRDVDEYVAAARAQKLVIRYVLETHRQEDFVMGSSALVAVTKAKVVSFDHPLFGHSDLRLADGEELALGKLKLRALHTPGHTPESTCYAVFVGDAPGRALGVFTGDTLFIGETGRTDLTDAKKTGEHAGQLFDSVHSKLLPLGDQAILWPAHGSGSVCGGHIADRDDSTLGLERTYNPVFLRSRQAFIDGKLQERIPRPPYFRHMEKVNLAGGLPPAAPSRAIPLLAAKAFASEMRLGLVVDTRTPEAFAAGHIPGSINVWLGGLPVFAGWIADEKTRLFLVPPTMDDLDEAVTHLARVGLDGVEGVLAGGFGAWRDAGLPLAYTGTTDARQLQRELASSLVLDVREDSEFEEEGHIPGARHLYVGYLEEHLDRIASDLKSKPQIVVTCSVGHRAGIATSILARRGFHAVKNLLGGMTAWKKLALPIAREGEHSITTPDIEGVRR